MRIAGWNGVVWAGALLALTALFGGEEDATGTGVSMGEPAEAGAAPGDAGLQAHVVRDPFQEVNGIAWHDHPAVLAGICASLRDEAVRKAVLELPGPPE